MKLVITGGHHSAALPIIKKIKEQNLPIEIYWIGHRHSLAGDANDTLEYKEITALGIPFFELRAGKVYKSLNLRHLIRIPLGFILAFNYLYKVKPDVILSFGGYLAVPVVICGWILGIPSITHEQTAVTGYANKLISFFAKKILVSWKDSVQYFDKNKVVYTGLPLRESIYSSDTTSFVSENSLPTIYITAGKTGSAKINDLIKDALPQLLMFCNVIHQCGDYSIQNAFAHLTEEYDRIKNALPGKYYLRKFVFDNEIGEAFSRANLVVGRAGAHTISELLALNKPALLIPIPWVSHNEQYKNAEVLKNAGLAEIFLEKDLNVENFIQKVQYMLHNLNSYKNNSADNYREITNNAADLILNEVRHYEKN